MAFPAEKVVVSGCNGSSAAYVGRIMAIPPPAVPTRSGTKRISSTSACLSSCPKQSIICCPRLARPTAFVGPGRKRKKNGNSPPDDKSNLNRQRTSKRQPTDRTRTFNNSSPPNDLISRFPDNLPPPAIPQMAHRIRKQQFRNNRHFYEWRKHSRLPIQRLCPARNSPAPGSAKQAKDPGKDNLGESAARLYQNQTLYACILRSCLSPPFE